MATRNLDPANPQSEPVESRRTPAATGVGGVTPDEVISQDGESSALEEMNMGEFSAEAARPTPLEEIARAERAKMPRD